MMGTSSLCFRFMLVISLSYTISSSPFLSQKTFFPLSSSIKASSSTHKAIAADLICILGSRDQASSININEAEKLKSCLKFLVPFTPKTGTLTERKRDLLAADDQLRSTDRIVFARRRRIEDELIWSPPASVLELARLAVDSGGDPGAIHGALDPTILPVPDVEGSKENRCELTRTPYGRLFINEELNAYLAFLFELIVARGPSVGLNVSLNRYDFFHGHLFLANGSGRLGILFHAKEYPACDDYVFPYNMGYCQRGSNVVYDESMNLRNILWLAPLPSNSSKDWLAPGVLVVLDTHPGGIIYKDLIPKYAKYVRTIYEEYFGDIVVDVNYLNVGDKVADYRIFIC